MAQKHKIPLTLNCPTCHTNYDIEMAVIPQGANTVLCHECHQSFEVNVLEGVNATINVDQDHAFQINKPCCEGFVYDAEGVDRLMRDGVVDAFTEVRPLRSKNYVPARQLQELW
ncbi:MJ0042-type zinc finger domain-containing protein [Acanthopleuribacter pedis]|uniref:Zinc finger/thioredoxin putative domain-containing protein n=1 Tax=Acanthopleuribacter pedis TaxID=442870 RepID=A0A8J7QM18_9BACT|nr:MJ0042-type zinc finger domain-containing protein [Acanthopleuribacter pedis]MBO1320828.1 hypothetical protein [Acanthopleuribacter pedis]